MTEAFAHKKLRNMRTKYDIEWETAYTYNIIQLNLKPF